MLDDKGKILECGHTYEGLINGVVFDVVEEKKDERGSIWLTIKIHGENDYKTISKNLRLLVKQIQ